ncbi:hypothetical protein PSQ90_09315 [Devosia rhodophyticola]|uniref:Uncharacterized protein n=1 Tax=Devosia rhodophyticola TaxID=3026423 RepID=A0ABY7YT32_9HYPH|nr:hypothetical protein [Devosia rhodophyticola]WDR04536.1 hypothetical protein PSQ90_09315 [Devosia rhodophyticola]
MDDASIDYCLDALAFIAERGHDLIDLYAVNPQSGCWTLKSARPEPTTTLESLCAWRPDPIPASPQLKAPAAAEIFAVAQDLADRAHAHRHSPCITLPANADQLRWFQL